MNARYKVNHGEWSNTIEVLEVAYYRNGVGGEPFHAVRFTCREDETVLHFLACVFDEPGVVSVICLDKISQHGVAFGPNSWRGDIYEPALRRAIRAAK